MPGRTLPKKWRELKIPKMTQKYARKRMIMLGLYGRCRRKLFLAESVIPREKISKQKSLRIFVQIVHGDIYL